MGVVSDWVCLGRDGPVLRVVECSVGHEND